MTTRKCRECSKTKPADQFGRAAQAYLCATCRTPIDDGKAERAAREASWLSGSANLAAQVSKSDPWAKGGSGWKYIDAIFDGRRPAPPAPGASDAFALKLRALVDSTSAAAGEFGVDAVIGAAHAINQAKKA